MGQDRENKLEVSEITHLCMETWLLTKTGTQIIRGKDRSSNAGADWDHLGAFHMENWIPTSHRTQESMSNGRLKGEKNSKTFRRKYKIVPLWPQSREEVLNIAQKIQTTKGNIDNLD